MANRGTVRWLSVALPSEHGSWGLVLEPIALGLLLAFTWPGAYLALAAFSAFLAYQPLRIVLKHVGEKKPSPRSLLARRFFVLYAAATLAFLLATLFSSAWWPLLPTLLVSPLLILFVRYELDGARRAWQAEISATLVFSSIVAGMALAADWALPNALALWAVMAARGLPSILYVRARLRLDKGKPFDAWGVFAAHALTFGLVFLLVVWAYLPALSLAALLLLWLRAGLGLSRYRRAVRARTIGFTEIGLGALTVLAVYIGTVFNL